MADRGHDEAEFRRELAAQGLDLVRQAVLALLPVDEGEERVAHFQFQIVELEEIGHRLLLGGLGGGHGGGVHRRTVGIEGRGLAGDLGEVPCGVARSAGEGEEWQHRHARQQREQNHHARRHAERLRVVGELLAERLVGRALHARLRDEDTGRRRDDEGRNLAGEAVTDGEQRVGLRGGTEGHALLGHADDDAADDVDEGDEQRGDGVSAHEFRGTVHGTEEGGFFLQRGAPGLRHLLVDETGREIGIDRHLLAGHRVEGEASRDFRDTARTLGDDDEVHDDENREHDDADDEVAAHHEVAEGFDDVACSRRSLVAMTRMRRVEARFRASRNRVATRSRVGKTVNSSGLSMNRPVIMMMTEMMIETASSRSSRKAGSGKMSTVRMPITAVAKNRSVRFRQSGEVGAVGYRETRELPQTRPLSRRGGARLAHTRHPSRPTWTRQELPGSGLAKS